MLTPRQTAFSRPLQNATRAAEPKQQPRTQTQPASAPQPIDAELLKLVGGAGTQLPVNRW